MTKPAKVSVNLFYPFYPDAVVATASTDRNGNADEGLEVTICNCLHRLLRRASRLARAPWGTSGEENHISDEKGVAA